MKIHYLSDTHLDFWIREQNPQSPKFQKQLDEYIDMLKLAPVDVLIIAGDLGHYYAQDRAFLLACTEIYRHVILVRGNHDMYLVSGQQQKKYLKDSMNRVFELKAFCRNNGIHYMDGDIISIDGVTFGGVGMSWDKSYYSKLSGSVPSDNEVREFFNNTMNDSRLIFMDGKNNGVVETTHGDHYIKSGFDPFDYFKKEYDKLQRINDFDDVDVMVSHYVPVNPYDFGGLKRYKEDLSSTFYMFDGYADVQRINAKYWIFGHMHNNYNFVYDDTKFLCNPIGYPGENLYNTVKEFEI